MCKRILISLALLILVPNLIIAEVKTVILAGGCFWCVQKDFDNLEGILETRVGYAGGDRPNPIYSNYTHYSEIYKTPHIEVVRVSYDDSVISFAKVIRFFLRNIDPTDGDGQFCDRGAYYRPAIFVASEEEKSVMLKEIKSGEEALKKSFAVDLLPTAQFWPGEDYHQKYYKKNPIRYKYYRYRCGRDARIRELWGEK
jgi:peptide-methionine (S)-S-oxide reductase